MTAFEIARRVALVPALIIAGLLVLAFALPCAAGCSPPEAAAECCDAATCGCVDCECDDDSKCRGCDGTSCDDAPCDTECCEDECPCDPCECYPVCECAGPKPTACLPKKWVHGQSHFDCCPNSKESCCDKETPEPVAAEKRPLTFRKTEGGLISVRGDVDELIAFVHRFQDDQWPEWRSNDRVVEQMKGFEEAIRAANGVAIDVSNDVNRRSFVAAIR